MSVKRVFSHAAIYGISSILGRILNWLLTPLYINIYPPDEYGILSDLYGFTFYWAVILTFGQETSFFRFATDKAQLRTYYSSAFSHVLFFSVLFLIIFGINYSFFADLLGYKGRENLFLWLLGIIVFDAIAAMPLAKLRYEEKALQFATISLLNIVITILLNLILVLWLKQPIEAVFWANFLASFIRLMMSLYGNLPDFYIPRQPYFKIMLKFGIFVMLSGLFSAINENLGRNLIIRLWEDGKTWNGIAYTAKALNGIYSANYKFGMFIALMTQAFRYAADPIMLKNADDKNSPLFYARVFYFYTTANLIMYLVISVFIEEIAKFNFFGLTNFHLIHPDYWIGLIIVPHILLANVMLGAFLNLSIWYKVIKKTQFGLWITLTGSLITLIINILFIPKYGFVASAYATLICYCTMAILCYLLGQKYYPIPYPIGSILTYLFISTSLIVLCRQLPAVFIGMILKVFICGLFIYGIKLDYDYHLKKTWKKIIQNNK